MNGGPARPRIPGTASPPTPQELLRVLVDTRPEPHPRGGGDPRRPAHGPLVRRRPRPRHRSDDLRDEEHGAVRRHAGGRDVRRLRGRVGRVGHPQRHRPRPGGQLDGLADSAARSRCRERAGRRGHGALHEHGRGDAPVRRPGRRRGLPLLAVRGRRLASRLRGVRAARPQGHLRVHRHGTRPLDGPLRLPHPGADASRRPGRHRSRDVGVRADPGALLLRHRARLRPLRRRHRHGPEPPWAGRARGVRASLALRVRRLRQHHRPHQDRLRVLRARVRLGLPVREVRPDLHAGVQRRRHGERRLRDHHRDLRLPRQGRRSHWSSAGG